ncbi:hypothetical protein [Streptomyces sp. NBC_00140]|uniref:hypothetical protein n=1 Tax=Streptomyces sp. NBC_00140 TaxID=2975664 RepID=UPI0022545F17|nr:hypothetical protein [Streptomyces sp. NBC_00140]MCX5336160.1 hypothetical protein [Streptomyces sp. NBC_00140]
MTARSERGRQRAPCGSESATMDADGLVGGVFRSPVRSDGFWWLGFDRTLPRSIEQLTVSGGVFAITDILVRPHPRDERVARRLQGRLLSDQHAALGATLVDRFDHPALAALRSWGWLDVREIWRPVKATLLRMLVLQVGERTPARSAGRAHSAWTWWPG